MGRIRNFKLFFVPVFFALNMSFLSCGGEDSLVYKVTLTQPTVGGTISANPPIPDNGEVREGTVITFTVKPDAGCETVNWMGAKSSKENSNIGTLTVSKDVEVSANISLNNGFVLVTPPREAFTTSEELGSEKNPVAKIDDTGPYVWTSYKGVFYGGSDPADRRKVKLSPYAIAKTEVTYKLWKEVYDWATLANGGVAGEEGQPEEKYIFGHPGRMGSSHTGANMTEFHPVTVVSWHTMLIWCNAYTEKTFGGTQECIYRDENNHDIVLRDSQTVEGRTALAYAFIDVGKKGFRLPTEAEWEYAARYSESSENAVNYGNIWLKYLTYVCGEVSPFEGMTHEVGAPPANSLGLFDMSVNVTEKCFDSYDLDVRDSDYLYEEDGMVVNPRGGIPNYWGYWHTNRGGNWSETDIALLSVGCRAAAGGDSNAYGFRLVYWP